jgi:cytochrome c5
MKRIPLALIGIALFSTPLFASDRLDDGKRNYEAICSSCHDTGVEDAPVVGKPEDWAKRPQLWEAVLFEHAESGYIKMPPRGNADYATDYDVDSAAEYMMHLTYPDLPTD